jgi:hypothetical protein
LAGSSSSRLWKPSLARISSAMPALISANSALTSGPGNVLVLAGIPDTH